MCGQVGFRPAYLFPVAAVPPEGEHMKRFFYAALAGLVFVLAVLVGTVISAIFLNGVEP